MVGGGAPQRESLQAGSLLRLYLLLTGRNLREEFQQNINQFSRCAPWSLPIGQCHDDVSHHSWSWCHPPGFAAFLGLELKYN